MGAARLVMLAVFRTVCAEICQFSLAVLSQIITGLLQHGFRQAGWLGVQEACRRSETVEGCELH